MTEEGTHEEVSCMYDNHFTVARTSGGEGYSGSVSIIGWVDYFNVSRDKKTCIHGEGVGAVQGRRWEEVWRTRVVGSMPASKQGK